MIYLEQNKKLYCPLCGHELNFPTESDMREYLRFKDEITKRLINDK